MANLYNVLLTPPFKAEHVSRFTDLEGYHFEYSAGPDEAMLLSADIILGNPKEEWINAAQNVCWVQLPFAGSDNYARMPVFRERGILLTNLSGAFGQSISEVVLGAVLSLYKHLPLYRDHQRAHEWVDEGWQETPVGKKLLILGAGNIGAAVAKLFRPFGCEIIGLWRTPREIPGHFDRMITMDALDQALSEADIIVGALPESAATHKLLDRRRLDLLKKKAVLVNVGRGGLIDHDALADKLKRKELWGAALDVTDPEPLPKDHPLWDCPNALITPHISGGSFGHLIATEETLFDICRTNLVHWQQGEKLLNRVDLNTGYRVPEDRY